MFTGIVEEIGAVCVIQNGTICIKAKKTLQGTNVGDSIAVNGVCLTVTELGDDSFKADIMNETLRRSSLSSLRSGSGVNLERAMSFEGRFGGHIVSGHIDGTGIISDIQNDGNAVYYTISTDKNILKYIIEKGSITIDGISLTVTKVTNTNFSVSIIPHTANQTILGQKKIGSIVNLENDIIGKYVEKLMKVADVNIPESNGITLDFLAKNGF